MTMPFLAGGSTSMSLPTDAPQGSQGQTPATQGADASSTMAGPVIPPKLKGIADSVKILMDRNATTGQLDQYLRDRGFSNGLPDFKTAWRLATQQPVDTEDPNFAASLDRTSGAPLKLRNAVAGMPTPDAQLALIRQSYPDAIPYRDTYVYTDPKTGKPTLFSEEGPGLHGAMALLTGLSMNGGVPNMTPQAAQAMHAIPGMMVDNAPTLGGLAGQIFGGARGAVMGAGAGTLLGPEGTIPGGVLGMLAGAGTGYTAGKEGVQAIQRGIAGESDPRSFSQVTDDIANNFRLGAESEAIGRATGPLLKGAMKAPSTFGDWLSTMHPEMGSALRPNTQVLLDYAKELGVPAGLAQTSKSLVLNSAAALLRRMPIASNVMNAADEAGNAGMSRAVQRVADQMAANDGVAINPDGTIPRFAGALKVGGAGVESGSAAMQEGAANVVQRYRTTQQALQQAFQQIMGGDKVTIPSLPNATAIAQGLEQEIQRAPGVNTPLLTPALNAVKSILSDAAPQTSPSGLLNAAGKPVVTGTGGIPLDILQRARTAIGEVAFDDSPLLRADPTVKYLRDVYGSLTKDIQNAAQMSDRAAGFVAKGPTDMGPAETALKLHDKYVSSFMDDGQLGNFNTFKKLAESPMGTDPLSWVVSNSKTNPQAVTKVLAQFSPPERNAVVGSVFQQMGRASSALQNEVGDVWDPKVFRANWDKMRLVRNQLFDETAYGNTAGDIDKIYQLAQRMPKPKGTSPTGGLLAPFIEIGAAHEAGAGAVGTAATVGAVTIGTATMARLLSDPDFSRLMLNAASAAQKGSTAVAPILTRLMFLQRQKPHLSASIGEYLDAVKDQGITMPGLQTFDRLSGSPGVSYQPH